MNLLILNYINSKFDNFFSKFHIFFKIDRYESIAPLKCHPILPQFIYKRSQPNQSSILKKIKYSHFWHFSTFLKIIFYCINYNYEPIKQKKCQKNVKNCLNLINIELVLEKKLRKKIGSIKKTFWPIRPIFFVVFKIVIFIPPSQMYSKPKDVFEVPSISPL